jgi:pimeloyl-ACP methyl ester carboxylesterase
MLTWALAILIGLIAAYCGLVLFALIMADGMMFPSPPSSYQDAPGQNKLPAPDGNKITAVFLPNDAADAPVLLFCHGNRQDLGLAEERLQAYRDHGWSVFCFDYPGYGTSTGQPSAAGCNAALAAAYSYLTALKEIPPERIVLYGLSLGGGPAVALASRAPVGGLILEGAFVSAFRVITHWRLLPWDRFDNLASIGRVRAPLLSIHAQKDRTTAWWHGKALFAAHPGPKQNLWVAGAGHNNILEVSPQAYWDAMELFRRRIMSSYLTAPAPALAASALRA